MQIARRAAALMVVVLCAACSDAAQTPDGGLTDMLDLAALPDIGAPLSGYKPCSVDSKLGGFTVTLAEDFTGVDGQVLDGVVPQNVPEEVQAEGSCRLLSAPSLLCSPPCGPGETCSNSGACITYPRSLSVGTVTVSGLNSAVSMSPLYGNNYTNPSPLPHPGFSEGADIRLVASGGDVEPFALSGQGIAPLVTADNKVTVQSGQSVDLQWTAASDQGLARVHIELNINNHGTTSAWIVCEAEDTGAFSIPAALVTSLAGMGLSGGPTIILARRTADATTISQGCVQLLVASELALEVEVPGLISCTEDKDCPDGQTCQANLSCG